MSNPFAIAALTATFGRLLRQVSLSGTEFSTAAPDLARAGITDRQLNLFLYSVTPNLTHRNADLPTRSTNGDLVGQPVLALDLHYLLTAWGEEDDDVDAHHVLARAMSLIHDRPVLTRASIVAAMAAEVGPTGNGPHPELAAADLADQVENVKLTLDPLSHEDLFKLWSAFQTGYRLSVAYQASLVLIERTAPRRSAPRPRQAHLTVLPLERPRIDRVDPTEATSGATVDLHGSNLAAEAVHVRIDGELRTPVDVTDEVVEVALPAGLNIGIHALSVVQEVDLEGTGVPLFESNVVPFVLIPDVVEPIASVAEEGTLQVSVVPPVERRQDPVVFVGSTAIPVPPRTSDTPTSILAVILPASIAAGDHLVRVRVDGAESELSVTGGVYSGPEVQVT